MSTKIKEAKIKEENSRRRSSRLYSSGRKEKEQSFSSSPNRKVEREERKKEGYTEVTKTRIMVREKIAEKKSISRSKSRCKKSQKNKSPIMTNK